jgi:predicted nucleic acid-binding protein
VVAASPKRPAVRIVTAGVGHGAIAAELAGTAGLRSEELPDVEIAALAIEHGLLLASHDHGFRRCSRLGFVDPLG